YGQPVLRKNFHSEQQLHYHEAFPHAPRASNLQHQGYIHDINDLPTWATDSLPDSKSPLPNSELNLRIASRSSLSKRQHSPGRIGRQLLRNGVVQVSTLTYIRYPEFNPRIRNVTEP
ncbi:MAG: hypothetical protein HETSPECPRED_001542, partial [Heterodermia speciosa]